MDEDRVKKFLNGHSGTELLKRHDLETYGYWQVNGEDPNCDMGGSHHEPLLGVFEGTLGDVIAYAVELDNFWQWGSGGRITKLVITTVAHDSVAVLRARRIRKAQLEAQLAEINEQLRTL